MVVRHPINDSTGMSIFGHDSGYEFYLKHRVTHSTEYITNSRGFKLFTQSWTPRPPDQVIGCVAVVHGYSDESSGLIALTATLFAKHGFSVCAIDHQGHGSSDSLDGLMHHTPDLNPVVDDCVHYFTTFRASHAPNLPAFLYAESLCFLIGRSRQSWVSNPCHCPPYAESLGGAISLLITLRQKAAWDGVVLNGAMCGVSPKFKPPWLVERLLVLAASVVPTWRVVPTRWSFPRASFKEDMKGKGSMSRKKKRPRAATVLEVLRVCKDLQSRFEEVEAPLLIVHGGPDVVCDPECVKELYQRAGSGDKTLKIYPDMWHQLVGEAEEDVNLVFGDVVEWLLNRADRYKKGGAANIG